MMALPSRQSSHTLFQISSRNLAEPLPTKTPELTSSNHFVKSPRSPAGQADSTKTITSHHLRNSSQIPRSCRLFQTRATTNHPVPILLEDQP